MSDNLEAALRRALGVELVDANGDPEEPLPTTPIALNDHDGLRAIIMHEMKNGAALNATRKNHEDALKTIGDIAGNR